MAIRQSSPAQVVSIRSSSINASVSSQINTATHTWVRSLQCRTAHPTAHPVNDRRRANAHSSPPACLSSAGGRRRVQFSVTPFVPPDTPGLGGGGYLDWTPASADVVVDGTFAGGGGLSTQFSMVHPTAMMPSVRQSLRLRIFVSPPVGDKQEGVRGLHLGIRPWG